MVIDDLDVQRIPLFPTKADAPVVVDPDAVLTLTVPDQFFQAVARRDA
jgi:hypothetical protein